MEHLILIEDVISALVYFRDHVLPAPTVQRIRDLEGELAAWGDDIAMMYQDVQTYITQRRRTRERSLTLLKQLDAHGVTDLYNQFEQAVLTRPTPAEEQ